MAEIGAKAGVPSAPLAPSLSGAARPDSMSLCWNEPAGNGATIDSYKVEMDKGDGRGLWAAGNTVTPDFNPEGLAPGRPYSFRVCAYFPEYPAHVCFVPGTKYVLN